MVKTINRVFCAGILLCWNKKCIELFDDQNNTATVFGCSFSFIFVATLKTYFLLLFSKLFQYADIKKTIIMGVIIMGRANLLPTWVATHLCPVRWSKLYDLVLARFPSRTRDSAMQKWFQNFGLIFFVKVNSQKGSLLTFWILSWLWP
jgi:hypothetical protein